MIGTIVTINAEGSLDERVIEGKIIEISGTRADTDEKVTVDGEVVEIITRNPIRIRVHVHGTVSQSGEATRYKAV